MFNDKQPHVHKPLTGHGLETEEQCALAFKRMPTRMCCERPTWPWLPVNNNYKCSVNFKLNFQFE